MAKEYSPVNDKTIGDVQRVNDEFYGDHIRESRQEHGSEQGEGQHDSTPEQRTARKENNPTKISQGAGNKFRTKVAHQIRKVKQEYGSGAAHYEQESRLKEEAGEAPDSRPGVRRYL